MSADGLEAEDLAADLRTCGVEVGSVGSVGGEAFRAVVAHRMLALGYTRVAQLPPERGVECVSCGDCRQPYPVWFADNDVWNLVMGGPEAKGDPGGMLCPRCFALRGETVYKNARWHLRLDRANGEQVQP